MAALLKDDIFTFSYEGDEPEGEKELFAFSYEGDVDAPITPPAELEAPIAKREAEDPGLFGNAFRMAGERLAELGGNLYGGFETLGAFATDKANIGGFAATPGKALSDETAGYKYLPPAEWKKYRDQEDASMLFSDIREEWKAVDLGSVQSDYWGEMKRNPSLLGKAKNLGAFGIETGIVSLSDMAAVVVMFPAWWLSFSEQLAQERAANDGREGAPTEEDWAIAGTTTAVIGAMERFGFEAIASAFVKGGSAFMKLVKAAVGEGGTEFVQEQMEFGVEVLGTKTGAQLSTEEYALQSLERGAQGLVGGVTAGTTLAAPSVLLGGARKTDNQPDQGNEPPELFTPTHKAGGGQDVQPVTKNGKVVPDTYINREGVVFRDASAVPVANYDPAFDVSAVAAAAKAEVDSKQGIVGSAIPADIFGAPVEFDTPGAALPLRPPDDKPDGPPAPPPPAAVALEKEPEPEIELADAIATQVVAEDIDTPAGKFRERTLAHVKEQGREDSITPNGNLVVYHVTSAKSAKSIESSGKFMGFPFFTLSEEETKPFAAQVGKNPTVMKIEVDPDIVIPTSGYFSSRLEGLTRGQDGVWKADEVAPGEELNTLIDEAANEAATSPENELTEPTQAQKEAGNYKKGTLDAKVVPWLSGMDIAVENPAGSKRQPEWPPLKNAYGYFKRTEAFDGDEVDVFIGPDMAEQPEQIFVIDQVDPKTGKPDEHKIILGVDNAEDAKKVYLDNYEKGWQGLGDIKAYEFEDFKAKLKEGYFKNSTPSRKLFKKQEEMKQQLPAQGEEVANEESEAKLKEIKDKPTVARETIKPKGRESEVTTATGTKIKTRFAVVDMADLVTSNDDAGNRNPNYPKELQPRDRSRGASMLQVKKIASNLNPELLEDSIKASDGAPIVGADGVVESGNARSMAIRAAYAANKGKGYRRHLIKNAASYGLSEADISGILNPVLVRVRQGDMDISERADFARQANQPDIAPMSPTEQAQADSARISDDDMRLYEPSDSGNILAPSNQSFLQNFAKSLGDLEVGGLSTSDGRWTKQMGDRVQAAVFNKAYGDERLLTLTAEEADPDIKNILSALNKAAPAFARARAVQSELGDLDIITDIVSAIDVIRQAKAQGTSVKQLTDQAGLFGDVDPAIGKIAEFLESSARSSRRMGIGFRAMGEFLERELTSLSQDSLFEMSPATKSDIIDAANKQITEEYGGEKVIQDIFAQNEERPESDQRDVDPGRGRREQSEGVGAEAETTLPLPDVARKEEQDDLLGKTESEKTQQATEDARREKEAKSKTGTKQPGADDLFTNDGQLESDLFARRSGPPAAFENGLNEAPKPGEPFLVMRIGSGGSSLKNVNAGNGVGVAEHIMREEDFEKPSRARFGDTVSLYSVTVKEGFGRYRGHYNAEQSKVEPESLVGREVGTSVVTEWNPTGETQVIYSFPEAADYTVEKLISISYEEIKAELQAREGYADMDDAGSTIGGRFLENYFQEKLSSEGQLGEAYAALVGKEISYEVFVEDEGKSYTVTADAAVVMKNIDARIDTLKELRACI